MSEFRQDWTRLATRLSTLALALTLLLGLTACASSSGSSGGAVAMDDETRGVISDTGESTNRLFRIKVSFTGFSEVVRLREGQTVTYSQPDGTYHLTPMVSKTEIGRVEIKADREMLGGTETVTPIFSIGEDYDLSHEVRDLDWPFLSVRVISVQPPIRRGS